MLNNDEKKERLKKVLDSFPTPVRVRNSKKVSYAWVVNVEFERISKLLRQGATFGKLFEHFASHNMLPENGDYGKLWQAYRREEKKRRQAEGAVSKTDNDTKKTAIPPVTPPPPGLKPPVQPTQSPPPPPIMGQQVVNRENETDEERRRRIRRELGTVINTGTSRIIKYSDGTFDVLDDDGNIQDYYVKPKFSKN